MSKSSSSFFPIPNLHPLLRSFNIPAPVIYPPGIDLCSFLNPNPHGGAGDRLQPIDVDPCAAPRTESITKTTDLTPSEHAGESLNEAPMAAAMASDSPSNSEINSPQILNDVVETKIEAKYAQIFHCDACNVNCNSEIMFKVHKEGRKHIKNLQKLSVSSAIIQETPPPVAEATSDQESEKQKTDFFRNEATCFVQNISIQGEKHETQSTSLSGTAAQPSNSRTQEVQGQLNVTQLFWCEICKINCTSDDNFRAHKLGKKHMKNLKNPEKIQAQPAATPVVSLAATPITKPVEKTGDSEEVKPGWKHMKNLQNPELFDPAAEKSLLQDFGNDDGKTMILESSKRKANGSLAMEEEGDTKRQKKVMMMMMKDEGASCALITCKACNVSCTNVGAFMDHLASKEHSAMAQH